MHFELFKTRRGGTLSLFTLTAVILSLILSSFLIHGRTAHADSSASITVSGSQMGISTQYIGANAGTSYDSSKFKDVGFNSMRIWDDMTEFEPTDDSSTYGSPSISQIKNAGSAISNNGLIPWGTWDNNFSSHVGFFNQIKNDNIRLLVSLRNTGNNHGQGWMQHQPPSTTADWNEWWEHVFAEVYWLNVRNNYHVDDWEVFNEPDNSSQGWNGTTQQYETFVQYTSDAIRYVYNTFLPGRTPSIYTSALSYPQAPANGVSGGWEDNVFSTVGNDFNAISYHYYHSDGEFSNGINIAHTQANNAGHSNYPVWITEWGSYDETSSQQGIDPNCDSNRPCAVRMIDDMIRGSQPGDHYLTGSEYYVWGPGSYGDSILDGNSNPRTVYYALRLGIRALQGGKPTYQSSSSTSDLDAITTKDGSGNIYLLTTNTSGTNYNVNEDVSALFSGSSGTTIYRYDSSNSDSSGTGPAVSNGHVSFSIPANGAVLIKIPNGGGALPSPWQSQDIGSVGQTGSAAYSNGTFTVAGSGSDIWNSSDAFRYVYQSLNGDGTIVARVASEQNTDPWAKAGVMIRESLTAGSTHAFMAITSGNGAAFQRRTATNGSSTNTSRPSVTAPYWVKLTRAGNTFTGSVSSNGSSWTQVGSDTISMASNVYVGLAVTAHNSSALNSSTFDNVSISTGGGSGGGSLSGQVATAAASYNLTSLGTSDWAHWGRGGTYGNFDHKSSGGSQISTISTVGSGGSYGGWTTSARAVSWSDGTPTGSASNDHGYIWSNGAANTGFSFTVPAGTTQHTLVVYVGGAAATCKLTAHLSDGSAADYSNTQSSSTNYQNVYTITFKAASAGQTLTITYLKTAENGGSGGSADLIAAWLS